ncbi:hypothetical protein D3C75_1041720 [compost metagenome]
MSVEAETIVIATVTIIVGDVIPERIAASPIIKPPTTVTVWPRALGRRLPASLKISNRNSIINVSSGIGNGSPCRELLIVANRGRGICSKLKLVKAI